MRRGDFAQAVASRGIRNDARKDGLVWALRVNGEPTDGSYPYGDVPFEYSVRQVTTSEAMLYGKPQLMGGFKLTLAGAVEDKLDAWGDPIGQITEDMLIVRGTRFDEDGARPHVTNGGSAPEIFNIEQIERLMNEGAVQEYWLFVVSSNGGPSRG